MIASLTGLDVSNASLYDGASSLAEAILMAVREKEKKNAKKIFVLGGLHPLYYETIESIVSLQDITLEIIPCDKHDGRTLLDALSKIATEEVAALVIQQPNFFGHLELVDELTNWAHEHHLLVIATVNPTSLALLKEPGQWGETGADIACGDGQPLGIPLASGGPYFGFLTCKKAFIRQMPGRIVGRTVDQEGKEGFTLTLQAREQHIRRAKAKSNICTNQGLLVTAATIYMSLMGPEGLCLVALNSHTQTNYLREQLGLISGVKVAHANTPFFHEFVIQLNTSVESVMTHFLKEKIIPGFDLTHTHPELGQAMLICVTETKTQEDLEHYIACMKAAIKNMPIYEKGCELC